MSSCYSNSSPMFQPAMRIISSITNETQALVTTTEDHDYEDGAIIRLIVPPLFGMQQINNRYGAITVVSSNSFRIDIDSTFFDPFAIPGSLPTSYTCAQTIPIAEISETLASATKNVLPFGGD